MNELRGLPVANAISENLKLRIENLKNNGIVPKLSVIRVGNNEDDISYEKGIIKKFTSLNALVDVIELPFDTNQEKIEATIISLNVTVQDLLVF